MAPLILILQPPPLYHLLRRLSLDLMGLIARSRFSAIVNTSVSYLTFLKKKKNKKKKKSPSAPSTSSSVQKYPSSNHRNRPDPSIKKDTKKKDINLEKQITVVDDKESTWLTTDRPSTNAYFEQCRSSLSHYLLDERLGLWLSRSSITKVVDWLSRPSSAKAADWLSRSSLSKEDESFILGRDLPSEEAEILMLTSSASNVPQDLMISLVDLDDSIRSSISGMALLEISDGEPLFWPLELKFDFDPDERVGYFTMSPRKVLKSIKSLQRNPTMVARLSTGSSCGKVVSLSIEGGSIPFEKLLSFKKDLFRGEDISFSDEIPIERLLELGEFDGHEGLDDDDGFSFDGSFLKN